jgi:hypothetical protein
MLERTIRTKAEKPIRAKAVNSFMYLLYWYARAPVFPDCEEFYGSFAVSEIAYELYGVTTTATAVPAALRILRLHQEVFTRILVAMAALSA